MREGIITVIQAIVFFLLDLVIYIKVKRNQTSIPEKKTFERMAFFTTVLEFVTIILQAVYFKLVFLAPFLQHLLYSSGFLCMTAVAYFWIKYLRICIYGKVQQGPLIKKLKRLPLLIIIGLCILSYWNHWVFYIDANGSYQRGDIFILQFLFPVLYFLEATGMTLAEIRRGNIAKSKKTFYDFFMFVCPSLIGAIMQVGLGIRGGYTQIGISLGMILIYFELYVEEIKKIENMQELSALNVQLQEVNKGQKLQLEEIRRLNEEMERQVSVISSMSKVYFTSFIIDLSSNTFWEMSNIENVRNQIGTQGKAQESLFTFTEKMVKSENKEELRSFVDLSTINERLRNRDFVTCDYIGNTSGWSQLYIIAADRNEEGDLLSVFVTSRLIHEEKKREEMQQKNLADALVAAQNANKAKTTFLNNMSHDIRTPMNAIIGFTALASSHIDNKDEVADYLNKIDISSQHLLSLINDVLDMSRIESGKINLEENEVYLPDVILALKDIVMPSALAKKLELSIDMANIVHSNVITDKLRLNQVFLNVLGNAIKFTPNGGSILFSVKELAPRDDGYSDFEFRIKDTGIGMSKEFISHIFESFTREKNSTVSGIQGTGLGMAITKNIVNFMGGSIGVTSEEGKGSEFVICLSFRNCDGADSAIDLAIDSAIDGAKNQDLQPESEGASKTVPEDKEFHFDGKRILLTEDNELNQEIAATILEEVGFVVDVAGDGTEAVAKMIEMGEQYDLILMDIQMPIMDGYEATEKIRSLPEPEKANIPIIAMTANAFAEDKEKAFRTGMNGHIAKPIDISKLLFTLRSILEQNKR